MKKITGLVAGGALALTLAACGSSSNAEADSYGTRLARSCDAGDQCEAWMILSDTKIVDRCPDGTALEGESLVSGDTKLLRMSGQAAVENVESHRFVGVDPSFWLWLNDERGVQHHLSDMRSCQPGGETSWSWVSRHHTAPERITIYEVPAGVTSMETGRGTTDEPGYWPID